MNHPDLSAPATSCSYTGDAWPLCLIMLKNFVLGLITLQLYQLNGLVWQRQYVWPHVRIGDEPLTWTGDTLSQRTSFSTLARAVVACCLVLRLLHLLGPIALASATTPTFLIISYIVSIVLQSVGAFYSFQYQLQHTSWRNGTFMVQGHAIAYARIYLRGLLVAITTLGVGYGYFAVSTRRYLIGQVSWGGLQAQYTGTEPEARKLYLTGGIASILSLGAYLPWHIAKLRRFHGANTVMGPMRLQVQQEGSTLSNLWVSNFFIYLGTLFLGQGWASHRSMRYQLQHLRIEGLTPTVQPTVPTGGTVAEPAAAEGLVDAVGIYPYPFLGA